MAASRRVLWIDIARGIGIVLVVYGHVLRGLAAAKTVNIDAPVFRSDYVIYTFHMPLFFVLAGLNVTRSIDRGSSAFLKGKLRSVAYPYFLWSLLQGSLQVLVPQYVNTARPAGSLISILWSPIGQFWFLYVLFWCHFLAWIARAYRVVLFALALVCLLAFPLLPPTALSSLAYSFPFYVLGVTASRPILDWEPSPATLLYCFGASGISFWLGSSIGRVVSGGDPSAPASLFASLAGISLVLTASRLLELRPNAFARSLAMFGRASLTIYIFHVIVAAATRVLLRRLHMTQWQVELILGTLAALLLPLAFHLVLGRVHLLAPLGLAQFRAKSRTAAIV